MARKKTRTAKKAPRRTPARARKAAKRQPAKTRARSSSAPAARASRGTDVERRWKEYWASRSRLEIAVEKVKTAREALQAAEAAERGCREEFETIKDSLTTLLDVEPASSAPRVPTAVPSRPQGTAAPGLPAPQVVPAKTKPAS